MSSFITNTAPVTLHEIAYLRAEQEARPWYVVYRPEAESIGTTAEPAPADEVIMTCENNERKDSYGAYQVFGAFRS